MANGGSALTFFGEWTTLGGGTGGATYQSPWFDVTSFNRVNVELLAPAISGGTNTAQLIGSSDMDTESAIGSATTIKEGSPPVTINTSNPPRYLRLQIVMASGQSMTLWARGVARNT